MLKNNICCFGDFFYEKCSESTKFWGRPKFLRHSAEISVSGVGIQKLAKSEPDFEFVCFPRLWWSELFFEIWGKMEGYGRGIKLSAGKCSPGQTFLLKNRQNEVFSLARNLAEISAEFSKFSHFFQMSTNVVIIFRSHKKILKSHKIALPVI